MVNKIEVYIKSNQTDVTVDKHSHKKITPHSLGLSKKSVPSQNSVVNNDFWGDSFNL